MKQCYKLGWCETLNTSLEETQERADTHMHKDVANTDRVSACFIIAIIQIKK